MFNRSIFNLLFSLCFLLSFSIHAQKDQQIDKLIQETRMALDSGSYDVMSDKAKKLYDLSVSKKDEKSKALAYNYLGVSHELKGELAEAISFYLKALNIQKKIGEPRDISFTYTNLGLAYWTQKELDKALEYFKLSLKYNLQNKDTNGIAGSYNNIGLIYMDKNDYNESAKYFFKSIAYDSLMNNKNGIAISYNNIGLIYRRDKEFKKAEEYFLLAAKIHKETGDKYGLVNSIINIGLIYEDQNQFEAADIEYKKGLKIALSTGNRSQIREIYKRLYLSAELAKKDKLALDFYKLMTIYEDSIANEEQVKKQTEAEMQYAFDQEKAKDLLKKQKEDLLNQQAKQRLRWWLIGFIVFAILITLFALNINKRRKLEIKQREIIAEKNQEILDSIQYAKRIQTAILPTETQLNELLSNYFIYYRPKDIVAGDFYWMEKIGNKLLFAVADCTGHGVPGALISVVCHNALNRSVREFHLIDPGQILNKTRELIMEEFIKSDEKMRDGMDISLCCLDLSTLKMQWSGANSPLWIKRQNQQEIEVFKAQKQPIGYFDELENFSSLDFQLEKGDSIYLFSDGYADQFGGPEGKKLKSTGMRNLILSVSEKSMSEQNSAFDSYFENWKASNEQIDDVCVFGFQV